MNTSDFESIDEAFKQYSRFEATYDDTSIEKLYASLVTAAWTEHPQGEEMTPLVSRFITDSSKSAK